MPSVGGPPLTTFHTVWNTHPAVRYQPGKVELHGPRQDLHQQLVAREVRPERGDLLVQREAAERHARQRFHDRSPSTTQAPPPAARSDHTPTRSPLKRWPNRMPSTGSTTRARPEPKPH